MLEYWSYIFKKNSVSLKKNYDPNLPIENMFIKVENADKFSADVNTPYSTKQVIDNAY